MNFVCDANALIAYLEDEPGAETVDAILSRTDDLSFVHSINLCEVYYGTRREFGEEAAQATLAELSNTGLHVRNDMDENLWLEAGRLKADYRRISLADCFCAALANRLEAEVVTADQEYKLLVDAGACKVRFIR